MEIYGQYKEMNKNAHILLFSIKRKQTKWNSLIQEIQIKGNTAEKIQSQNILSSENSMGTV